MPQDAQVAQTPRKWPVWIMTASERVALGVQCLRRIDVYAYLWFLRLLELFTNPLAVSAQLLYILSTAFVNSHPHGYVCSIDARDVHISNALSYISLYTHMLK